MKKQDVEKVIKFIQDNKFTVLSTTIVNEDQYLEIANIDKRALIESLGDYRCEVDYAGTLEEFMIDNEVKEGRPINSVKFIFDGLKMVVKVYTWDVAEVRDLIKIDVGEILDAKGEQ